MSEQERMKQKAEKKRLKKKVAGGQKGWEPRGTWGREEERTLDGQGVPWGSGTGGSPGGHLVQWFWSHTTLSGLESASLL